MPDLAKGAKGKPVERLQGALNKAGARPKLKVDGIFGPQTQAAVKAFRKQRNLKAGATVDDAVAYALGLGKRPKSLDWPHGEMDVFYGKVIEARRFNGARAKEAIAFLKAAQDDTDNVRKALAVKEAKLTKAERSLEKIFANQVQTYNKLEKIRLKCEQLGDPVEIRKLHKEAGAMLEAWKDQAIKEGWFDFAQDVSDTLAEIKAYSKGLRSIKRGIGA